MSSSQTN